MPYLLPPADLPDQWLAIVDAAGGALPYTSLDALLPWMLDTYAPDPLQCMIHPSQLGMNGARLDRGAVTTRVHLLIANPGEGQIARTLRVADGVAIHEMYFLPSALQGLGIGREMVRRAVHLYDRLGIRRVEAQCDDVGKYVWARCGFDFVDEHEHTYVYEGLNNLAGRLGFEAIPRLDHSWDYAATLGRDPATGQDTVVSAADLASALGVEQPGLLGGATFALGKALMRFGPGRWRGILDLTPGGEARQVLASYTGLEE